MKHQGLINHKLNFTQQILNTQTQALAPWNPLACTHFQERQFPRETTKFDAITDWSVLGNLSYGTY